MENNSGKYLIQKIQLIYIETIFLLRENTANDKW
jgi:hypothetical protein